MADVLPSAVNQVRIGNGEIVVDAALIARGLKVAPSRVQEGIRAGAITSTCEVGVGDDGGTYRLTFRTQELRFRLVIDHDGRVIRSGRIRYPRLPKLANEAPGKMRIERMNDMNARGEDENGHVSDDERRLLPMLIWGLVLIVAGMVLVMAFV